MVHRYRFGSFPALRYVQEVTLMVFKPPHRHDPTTDMTFKVLPPSRHVSSQVVPVRWLEDHQALFTLHTSTRQ
jgi:hypothetical protein